MYLRLPFRVSKQVLVTVHDLTPFVLSSNTSPPYFSVHQLKDLVLCADQNKQLESKVIVIDCKVLRRGNRVDQGHVK